MVIFTYRGLEIKFVNFLSWKFTAPIYESEEQMQQISRRFGDESKSSYYSLSIGPESEGGTSTGLAIIRSFSLCMQICLNLLLLNASSPNSMYSLQMLERIAV